MRVTLPSPEEMIQALGGSLEPWYHQCHAASLRLVNSGVFGDIFVRVARGTADGVPGQHSWIVVGRDCYNPAAPVVDATLWSYVDSVAGIWIGKARERHHTPHGAGSIWDWGRPGSPTGPVIELRPRTPLSRAAQRFLDLLGPLDYQGWSVLAHAPVQGWPAGEIYEAMSFTPGLKSLVPIDRVGMLTDLNPGGLYLSGVVADRDGASLLDEG